MIIELILTFKLNLLERHAAIRISHWDGGLFLPRNLLNLGSVHLNSAFRQFMVVRDLSNRRYKSQHINLFDTFNMT